MKRVMSVSLPVAALVVALSAGDARAQSNPWSVSFDLGTQIALSGDVHGGGSGTVLNLPTQVQARSYEDIYGNGFYWAAGLGYRVGEAGEIRVQGSYTTNPADRLQVGTVAGLPLFALFDDYKAFGMDFGYRQYFGTALAVGDPGRDYLWILARAPHLDDDSIAVARQLHGRTASKSTASCPRRRRVPLGHDAKGGKDAGAESSACGG